MAPDHGDVLSFGPPERRRTGRLSVLLVLLAASSLLVGYLVGSRAAEPVAAAGRDGPAPEVLVAGVVRESFAIDDELSFDVVLRNTGDESLDVTVREVGRVEVVQPDRPSRIPAHAARTVDITVPDTCPFGRTSSLTELTAEVGSGAERRRVTVPVLEAGDLAAYLSGLCAAPTTESPATLRGVWVLDEAFARWTRGEGELLLWFRPDSTFVIDDIGRLFTRDTAASGDFRVKGGRLHLRFRRGLVCAPDEQAAWDVHRRTAGVVTLRYVDGGCIRERGAVWVLRRVLSEVPAGVDW